MPRHTIKAGKHDDTRLFSSWPHIGKTSMSRYVTFHESCRYLLPAYNALDINKLFGLSFGFLAVHENSARFGWYFEQATDSIVLVAYVYRNGQRNWNSELQFPVVARVKIGQRVRCEIEHGYEWGGPDTEEKPLYLFSVEDDDKILGIKGVERPAKLPSYGLTHSLWFGGSKPAPHDMHVTIDKA